MKPYFSIIVPTLNRVTTLEACLATIALQDFSDFEVIVSDNCSDDSTKSYVESLLNTIPTLRYVRPPTRLSMSRHWEFAFSQSRGIYVCYVGDDDGIMLGGLTAAFKILELNGRPQALNSVNTEYHWPNSPIPFHQSLIRVPVGESLMQLRKSSEMLELLKRNLRLYVELPMLYRGFVRRDVLQGIKVETGVLFRSSIPDVYAAVAVAATIHEYLFINTPLFVEGVSGASNGASCLWGGCDSDKEFFVEDSIPFHSDLNFCGTEAYLHAESLLQCRDAGLLKYDAMMDPVDLVSHAAAGAGGLIKERYDQVWDAIMETAKRFDLLPLAETLRTDHPNTPICSNPFPTATLWSDVRGAYEPALAVRADRFGYSSVLDCVQLLDSWVRSATGGGSGSEVLAMELAERYVLLDRSSTSKIAYEGSKYTVRQAKAEIRVLRRKLAAMKEERAKGGIVGRMLRGLRGLTKSIVSFKLPRSSARPGS